MIGHFAERVIEELRVEKVIVGMRGVHPRYGLTSEDPQELMTDRKILVSAITSSSSLITRRSAMFRRA